MTLLPLFGKEYILSLTIGCFLANVIGPYGVPDIILGTLATFISVYLVYLTGKHMKGYVYVSDEGISTQQEFDYWISLCLNFNKIAKVSKKKKKE